MTRPTEVTVSLSEWEKHWDLCQQTMKLWLAKPQSAYRDEEMMRQFERLKGNIEGDKPRYQYYA